MTYSIDDICLRVGEVLGGAEPLDYRRPVREAALHVACFGVGIEACGVLSVGQAVVGQGGRVEVPGDYLRAVDVALGALCGAERFTEDGRFLGEVTLRCDHRTPGVLRVLGPVVEGDAVKLTYYALPTDEEENILIDDVLAAAVEHYAIARRMQAESARVAGGRFAPGAWRDYDRQAREAMDKARAVYNGRRASGQIQRLLHLLHGRRAGVFWQRGGWTRTL